MAKPTHAGGYDKEVTENCERVLVTLLRGLGPWKESVYLVGGLTPRYLVPKGKKQHAGTGDVDNRRRVGNARRDRCLSHPLKKI